MICPLCGTRKARRSCPALGHDICAVCCGTKRLTQIQCPASCGYLVLARDHPAAAVVRQQQHDVSRLMECIRDFSERQSQLFLMTAAFLVGYEPPPLQPLVDEDIAAAAAALAATFETATRGVIYEHRPPTPAADRLAAALKPLFAEAGSQGGSAFERDAAVVLRRVHEAANVVRDGDTRGRQPFLELLQRMVRKPDGHTTASQEQPSLPDARASRLIVP
jgi:hypothetical protein